MRRKMGSTPPDPWQIDRKARYRTGLAALVRGEDRRSHQAKDTFLHRSDPVLRREAFRFVHELQLGDLSFQLIARKLFGLQAEACDCIGDAREGIHVAKVRKTGTLASHIYTARYHSHLIDNTPLDFAAGPAPQSNPPRGLPRPPLHVSVDSSYRSCTLSPFYSRRSNSQS